MRPSPTDLEGLRPPRPPSAPLRFFYEKSSGRKRGRNRKFFISSVPLAEVDTKCARHCVQSPVPHLFDGRYAYGLTHNYHFVQFLLSRQLRFSSPPSASHSPPRGDARGGVRLRSGEVAPSKQSVPVAHAYTFRALRQMTKFYKKGLTKSQDYDTL